MSTNRRLKYNALSDQELIARYKKKSNKEFIGELFQRYSHLVIGVCYKYLKNEAEAQDATMHIFEKMFEDVKKHEIAYFKGWLHMVAKNHCLMKLRSVKGKAEQTAREVDEKDAKIVEFDPLVHQEEKRVEESAMDKLGGCLEKLKKEQKECIQLFFLEKKCYQEIADKTKHELKKVKSYIQNGKRNLKICMENDG